MAGLSKNAFAMTAKCPRTGKTFGITVDKIDGVYQLMWAFKINPDVAKREGFESTAVRGRVEFHPDYPGCPYCEEKQFYVCGNCQRVACYHGESTVECPHCGSTSNVICVEEMDLKGGSY